MVNFGGRVRTVIHELCLGKRCSHKRRRCVFLGKRGKGLKRKPTEIPRLTPHVKLEQKHSRLGREPSHQTPNLPVHWPWTSPPPELWEINSCVYKPPSLCDSRPNGRRRHSTFQTGLLHLRFLHMILWLDSSFLFGTEKLSITGMYQSVCSFTYEEHLGCFKLLVFISEAKRWFQYGKYWLQIFVWT